MNIGVDKILEILHERFGDSYYDLYPDYSKPKNNKDVESFAFKSKRAAFEEAEQVYDLFCSLPDPIPLYRTVSAVSKESIDLAVPGYHWSFNRASALNFASLTLSGQIFLLSCYAPKSSVHWGATLRNYLEYSGEGLAEAEDEITLESNRDLIDVKIEKKLKPKEKWSNRR